MIKILVAIPCLFDEMRTKQTIESIVYHKNVDVLLMDNGSEEDVSRMLLSFVKFPNVEIVKFEKNIFVNPVWNYALKYFNDSEIYTHLIIQNSDLVLSDDWEKIINKLISINPNYSALPVITQDKGLLHPTDNEFKELNITEISKGHPGVFILISKELSKIAYPIPSEIVIWFGDNWIYEIIRNFGGKTFIINDFYVLDKNIF